MLWLIYSCFVLELSLSQKSVEAFLIRLFIHAFGFIVEEGIVNQLIYFGLFSGKHFDDRVNFFRQDSYTFPESLEILMTRVTCAGIGVGIFALWNQASL